MIGNRLATSSSVSTGDSSSTPSKPSIGVIVGGVIGGVVGLAIVIILAWFFLKRQRSLENTKKYTSEPSMSATNPIVPRRFNINEALASGTSQTNLTGATRQYSPSNGHEGLTTNSNSSDGHLAQPVMMTNEEQRIRPLPGASNTQGHMQALSPNVGIGADDSSLIDRRTLYTLPSYNEPSGRQQTEARDLSEADLNAISRRMREFMGVPEGQGRQDPNSSVIGPSQQN
jgi:hypothetical protein